MSIKYLALALGAAAAFPSINIKENGKDKTLYITSGQKWYHPKGGDTMDIPHGGRSYLALSDSNGPNNFYGVNLLGGSIEYDVDLSASGCSCNAALYLIRMPGLDWNGNPSGGRTGDFYCDANMVNNQWCPEFDIMEANTWAFRATPHACDAPSGKGHYAKCERSGTCSQRSDQKLKGIYGPGNKYPINTLKMFHVKISFAKNAQFKVELSQGGRKHSMQSDNSCQSYLNRVKQDLASNMALAVSSWGSSYEQMKWLDKETGCRGDCNNKPTLVIKNIAYKTAGHSPTNYDWGNPCNLKDGECSQVDCMDKECRWSWPHTDPAKWKSKDAKCRCHKVRSEFEPEEVQEESQDQTFDVQEEQDQTPFIQ